MGIILHIFFSNNMRKNVLIRILRREGDFLHSWCIGPLENTLSWLFKMPMYVVLTSVVLCGNLIQYWDAHHVCFIWRKRRVCYVKMSVIPKIV